MKFPLASDPSLIDERLSGRKVFFLIWTTTPWTLPANLGIAVHPDFEYAAFENNDEVYVVASELLGVPFDPLAIWLVGSGIAAAGALTVLPRLWASSVVGLIAGVILSAWPNRGLDVMAAALALNFAIIVSALRRRNAQLKAGAA